MAPIERWRFDWTGGVSARGKLRTSSLRTAWPGFGLLIALAVLFPAEAAQARGHRLIDPAAIPDAAAEVRQVRLRNGFTLILDPRGSDPDEIFVGLMVRAGFMQQEADQYQAAHIVEHTLASRPSRSPGGSLGGSIVAREWAANGGSVTAFTGWNTTAYSYAGPEENLSTVLSWFRLIAWGGAPDLNDLARDRATVADEIGGWEQTSASRWLISTGSPELQALGRREEQPYTSLRSVDPGALLRFYKRWYRPECEALVVTGKFDADELERRLSLIYSDPPSPAPIGACPASTYSHDTVSLDPQADSASLLLVSGPGSTERLTTRAEVVRRLLAQVLDARVRADALGIVESKVEVPDLNSFFPSPSVTESRLIIRLVGRGTQFSGHAEAVGRVIGEVRRQCVADPMMITAREAVLESLPTAGQGAQLAHQVSWARDGRPGLTRADADHVRAILASVTCRELSAMANEILSPDDIQLVVTYAPADDPSKLQTSQLRAAFEAGQLAVAADVLPGQPDLRRVAHHDGAPMLSEQTTRQSGEPTIARSSLTPVRLSTGVSIFFNRTPDAKPGEVSLFAIRPLGIRTCPEDPLCTLPPKDTSSLSQDDAEVRRVAESDGVFVAASLEPAAATLSLSTEGAGLDRVLNQAARVFSGGLASATVIVNEGDPLKQSVEGALAGGRDRTTPHPEFFQYFRDAEKFLIVLSGDVDPVRDLAVLDRRLRDLPPAERVDLPDAELEPVAPPPLTEIQARSPRAEVRIILVDGRRDYRPDWQVLRANNEVVEAHIWERLRLEEGIAYSPGAKLSVRPDGSRILTLRFTCAVEDVERGISAAVDEMNRIAVAGYDEADVVRLGRFKPSTPSGARAWAGHLLSLSPVERLREPVPNLTVPSPEEALGAFVDFMAHAEQAIFVARPAA